MVRVVTSFLCCSAALTNGPVNAITIDEETCDAASGQCQATSGSAMMQMKVQRVQHQNDKSVQKDQLEEKADAESTVRKIGDTIRLHSGAKGVITYAHIDYKQHKLIKVKQALAKKKQGLLSTRTAAVLEAALKRAEEIENAADEAENPNASPTQIEAANHSSIAEAERDGESAMERDHGAVLRALEEFSESESVEDANKSGAVIDGNVQEELFGIPDSPMQTAGNSSRAVQGDMVGDRDDDAVGLLQGAHNGTRWYGQLWEQHMDIKFCFDTNIDSTSKTAFLDAIQHYHNLVPCLRFREVGVGSNSNQKCAQEPGIYVQSRESGCWANVGQPHYYSGRYGGSVCNLSPGGCDTMGVAAHEIGHNIGMMHEQARTDSVDHVKIFWDNIQPDYVDQYTLENKVDKQLPYDIMSLMHYSDSAFGKYNSRGEKMKTMQSVDGTASVMGNYMGLTRLDTQQIGMMYGCLDTVRDFKVCTNDVNKCVKEACVCHQDPQQPDEKIKSVDADGCQRCLKRCPDGPYGTAGVCGCPEGYEKSCFRSGGKQYCGCEQQSDAANAPTRPPTWAPTRASPTPAPTRAPTRAPTDAPTKVSSSSQCKPDAAWWCEHFEKSDCGPNFYVNGQTILEGCATLCGLCDTPPPCFDVATSTCQLYAEYCGNPYVTLDSMPFPEACPVTCNTCN